MDSLSKVISLSLIGLTIGMSLAWFISCKFNATGIIIPMVVCMFYIVFVLIGVLIWVED